MKQMIVTLVIALSSFSAVAGEGNVNQKVLDAFKTEFATATEVTWTEGDNFYKATFNYNGKYVFAYYDANAELLGMTRYLSPVDLPLFLQNGLKKNYEGYWISDLFEVAKSERTNYYITIENADTKLVLKSEDNSWSTFSNPKKS